MFSLCIQYLHSATQFPEFTRIAFQICIRPMATKSAQPRTNKEHLYAHELEHIRVFMLRIDNKRAMKGLNHIVELTYFSNAIKFLVRVAVAIETSIIAYKKSMYFPSKPHVQCALLCGIFQEQTVEEKLRFCCFAFFLGLLFLNFCF